MSEVTIVAIVAVTEEGKVLLAEQFRAPVEKNVIEFPGGKTDLDEPLEQTAKRELLEETGYQARSIKFLAQGPIHAGKSPALIAFFLASGLRKISDGEDRITLHEIPLKEIESWLKQKERENSWIDPGIYAGLYFLK